MFNIQTFTQSQIEGLTTNNGFKTALISITTPGSRPVRLHAGVFGHTLRLIFDDATPTDMPTVFGSGPKIALFNPTQAAQVLEFVAGIKDDIETLAIHCYAGESRSTAIAYAIQTIYTNNAECPKHWSKHNTHVFKMLSRAQTI